jgi:hypothetical protein
MNPPEADKIGFVLHFFIMLAAAQAWRSRKPGGRSRVADLSGLWLLFMLIFGKDGQDFGRLFRGYYRAVVIVVRVAVIGAGRVLI